jgi:hypothetical protein
MWLLDHNLPIQLRNLLKEFQISVETTSARKWEKLFNGNLVETAYAAGFRVILTRDLKFGEAAARALSSHPEMAVVLVKLSQRASTAYLEAFRSEWNVAKIVPLAGKLVEWPRKSI